MKTVLLCGGRGTRLSEMTTTIPKPMVPIGDHPILWHIMHIYEQHRFKDFILALGYKGNVIKEYFLNFYSLNNDMKIDLGNGHIEHMKESPKNWNVSLIDTGLNTMTGGRLLRLKDQLTEDGTFMMTYGDGVADINIEKLVKFHKSHGKLATLTIVHPPSRFGLMEFKGDQILSFKEKPQTSQGWINGGFFVLEPKVFDYISGDNTVFEREPLERLAEAGQLMAYRHRGFWQCMDTMRDKNYLNSIWNRAEAPWYDKTYLDNGS